MGAMAHIRKRHQPESRDRSNATSPQQHPHAMHSNRSASWPVRGRVFAFHGLPPSRRAQWTRVLHGREALTSPTWRRALVQYASADKIYVITDYWVDRAPPTTSQIVVVTEFWLHEVLQTSAWVAPADHPFYTPPPFAQPAMLSYPMDYQVELATDVGDGETSYVAMLPCSPANKHEDAVPLWPYIVAYLQQPTQDARELATVIQSITGEDRSRLNCLHHAIDKLLSDLDRDAFFNVVLPVMKQRVIDLPFRFPRSLRLLTPLQPRSPVTASALASTTLELSRDELLSLLCGLFFAVFPGQTHVPTADFPWFNMEQMMRAAKSTPDLIALKAHKIRTVIEYFLRVVPRHRANANELADQRVTFTRVALHTRDTIDHAPLTHLNLNVNSASTVLPLSSVRIETSALIEDLERHLQIDFANMYAGGGVMNGGCVQEEIRFLLSPELLVACLVFAKLAPHESFAIHGSERFSNYTGYGGTYRFAGSSTQDRTPMDASGSRRQSVVVGIDAISYGGNATRQYTHKCILRDLVKAQAGFAYPDTDALAWPIATGNWGCGVFRGDAELKFLIQWLAASLAHRHELVYVIFEKGGDLEMKIQRLMSVCRGVSSSPLLAEWLVEFLMGLERSLLGEGRPPSVLAKAAVFIQAKSGVNTPGSGFGSPPPLSGAAPPAGPPRPPPPPHASPRPRSESTEERGASGASGGGAQSGGPLLKQPKLTSFWK